MKGAGADYTETDNNTITFVTAPITDSVLLVTYQHTVSTTGNADTVDGYHANATPTANNIPVLDSNALLPVVALPTFYAADAEATDTYAITLSPVPAAYTTGMVVRFKANTVNTGAATLNVNSLGAKTIVKNFNVTLADGDIKANQIVEVIYDGTNFQLLSQISNVFGNNPYQFSAYRNAALNSNAGTLVFPFDTENYDTNNNFDITTNKGRYTVPITGYYLFTAGLTHTINERTIISLLVGGAGVRRGQDTQSTAGPTSVVISAILYLTKDQYVELEIYKVTATAMLVGSIYCWFDGRLMNT